MRAYSFFVTVTAEKKINSDTGMTVDLIQLDKCVSKVLKQHCKIVKNSEIQDVLKSIQTKLIQILKLDNTKLISIQFDECRGGSFLLKMSKIYFLRQDFAINDKNELFKSISYFDQKNKLVQIDIENLKHNTKEKLIL